MVHINYDKLVKEKSFTKNSRDVSGIKATNRSKELPNDEK